MTDEIIEMARQAGFPTDYNDKRLLHAKELEAFAKLVEERAAAKERAEISKLFDTDLGFCNDPMGQEALNQMKEAVRARGEA